MRNTFIAARRALSYTLVIGITACQKDLMSPPLHDPETRSASSSPQEKRARFAMSDTAVWNAIRETDSTVVIAFKDPGTERGMSRGRVTVSPQRWRAAARELAQNSEVQLVSVDTMRYPMVRVKPSSLGALQRIRQLPFVDYVEPNLLRVSLASGDGCDWGSSGGDSPFQDPELILPSGDKVAATYGPTGMNVPNAWLLATGFGVTIGVIDTGLGSGNGEFVGSTFSSGQSTGRTLKVLQDGAPSCSHGTRIAALATAPMNGSSTAGVAYRSSLIAIWHGDGETSPTGLVSAAAVDIAADSGARVIVMAFGFIPGITDYSETLSDVIDYNYYQRDVMFVGAAGTCPGSSSCPQMESAVFPAFKEEVLAVTGANSDGTRHPTNYNYGAKSGVIAYTGLATVGLVSGILTINGSSASTGFIGGAAALIRQRYPTLSARGVMDQLIKTGGASCGAPSVWRDALVNVAAAVGAPCILRFLGTLTVTNTANAEDYWALVRRTVVVNAPPMGFGGSGTYNAQWTTRPEQVITSSTEGNVTDGSGNTYWQSRKSIRFLPAWDGLPYRTVVAMSVVDPSLGTNDPRTMSVLVCPSVSNCANTNRSWPGDQPPPAQMSALITGAASVPPSSSCNYVGSAANGTEPFSYEWFVNGSAAGTDGTFSLSTPSSGSVSLTLKVTDADSHVAWAAATPVVDQQATCFDQRPGALRLNSRGK